MKFSNDVIESTFFKTVINSDVSLVSEFENKIRDDTYSVTFLICCKAIHVPFDSIPEIVPIVRFLSAIFIVLKDPLLHGSAKYTPGE